MIVTLALLLLLATAVAGAMGKPRSGQETWNSYLTGDLSGAERALGPLAQRFANGRLVRSTVESKSSFEKLSRDITLGQSFSGSLEVYLSVQLAAAVIGLGIMTLSFIETQLVPFQSVGLVLFGLIIAYLPFDQVQKAATKRTEEIIEHLPRFADLLLMVLSSMSVPQALRFTAARDEGPVAYEMSELVRMLSLKAMPEREAFELIAARMGTQAGRDFIETLAASYLEGTASVANIRAQVESLRVIKFQDQRSLAKKIPVKLVVVFTLHFLPLLLVLSFLPILFSMGNL